MRRNSFRVMLTSMLLAGAVLTSLSSQGQIQSLSPEYRYLLTDKEAILLLPPELVAAPNVVAMDWSPDSKSVVTVRIRQQIPTPAQPMPPADMSIVVWNMNARHAQESWKKTFPVGGNPRDTLRWLPTTLTAIQEYSWLEKVAQPGPDNKPMETTQMRQGLLWIDSQRGFVKEIPEAEGDAIFISPSRPLAVIVHGWPGFSPDHTFSLTSVRSDGALGKPVALPDNSALNEVSWSEDGSQLNLLFLHRIPEKKSIQTQWMAFNPVSGSLAPLPKPPVRPSVASTPPPQSLKLKTTLVKAQEENTVIQLPALWLETTEKTEQPRTLVSGDARNGKLSPNGNAILYTSHGAAWVTPLFRVSKEEFKTAQLKAQRTVALSNGKQLGLALMMWAQDYDETFPTPDDINGKLEPYLKNDSLFEGFNYTYKGGPLSDISEPANTVLGTVDGPGGVAVIYADGHVKWQNR